jgi:DNA-binding LytR/AlgR family response regulator
MLCSTNFFSTHSNGQFRLKINQALIIQLNVFNGQEERFVNIYSHEFKVGRPTVFLLFSKNQKKAKVMSPKTVHIGSRKKLRPTEIIYIQADVNYSIIKLLNGTQFHVATTLKVLEERLAENGFLRPNRAFLINPQYITKYEGGVLELSNHTYYVVSRRKRLKYDLLLSQNLFGFQF